MRPRMLQLQLQSSDVMMMSLWTIWIEGNQQEANLKMEGCCVVIKSQMMQIAPQFLCSASKYTNGD